MTIAVRAFSLAIGLVFGLFQTGYIVGKAKGVDLRKHGSGNSGTTNAVRVMGTKFGLLVLLGDALKTVFAMLIVFFTFGNAYPDLRLLLTVYAAMGAILSHDFPFYMHFKGGKGIACTAGLCTGFIIFNPLIWVITFIVFLIPFVTTKYVSLGSLCVYVALVIEFIVFGQNCWLNIFGFEGVNSQSVLIEVYVIIFLLAVLAFFQHRKNIVRLVKGEESKTFLSKKKRDEYNKMRAEQEAAKAAQQKEN